MRTRARNEALVLGGMLALNAIVSAGAAFYLIVREREWRRILVEFQARVTSAERTCNTAAAVTTALADVGAPVDDLVDDDAPPFEPVVVGYGQTRSPKAFWIYRDVRDAWGVQRREYLQSIPFEALRNETSEAVESKAKPDR